jgi:hypothetical protein
MLQERILMAIQKYKTEKQKCMLTYVKINLAYLNQCIPISDIKMTELFKANSLEYKTLNSFHYAVTNL